MKTPFKQIVIFIAFAAVFQSCDQTKTPAAQTKILHSSLSNEPLTADPHSAWDQASGVIVQQVFEGLLEYSPDGKELVPNLAENWNVSSDGSEFDFELRHGIHFQNDPCFPGGIGREMIANDVIYSWERKVPGRNFRSMITRPNDDSVVIKSTGKYSLNVRFSQPRLSFLKMLTRTFAFIIPYEAVQYYGDNINRHPVGTGPFCLDKWEKAKEIMFSKNINYWGKDSTGKNLPYLDGLTFKIFPNEVVQFNEFTLGNLHLCSVPPKLYSDIIDSTSGELFTDWRNKGIRLYKSEGALNTSFILLSSFAEFELPPFSEGGSLIARSKKLRRAFNFAVNREELIRKSYPGRQAIPAKGFLPLVLSPNSEVGYFYNPDSARQYLAAAGFPNGRGLPEFKLVIASTSRDVLSAEIFKNQLAEFGIKIRIILAPFSEIRNACRQQQAEMEWNGWIADFPDAINFIETVDMNTTAIDSEPVPEKRNKLISEWEEKYLKRASRIFLLHRTGRATLVSTVVKNYLPSQFSNELYKFVDLVE